MSRRYRIPLPGSAVLYRIAQARYGLQFLIVLSCIVLLLHTTLFAAPPNVANNARIASVQVLGGGDPCRGLVPGQCGSSLKITFLNGQSRLIQKETWAAAVQGPDISDDRLSICWDVIDTELDPNGVTASIDAFRAGSAIHAFNCGNILDHYFAEGGKWLVLSCGNRHKEGYDVRDLEDVASGKQIAEVRSVGQGETPVHAPKWAQHDP